MTTHPKGQKNAIIFTDNDILKWLGIEELDLYSDSQNVMCDHHTDAQYIVALY